jgi:hypothetical protein
MASDPAIVLVYLIVTSARLQGADGRSVTAESLLVKQAPGTFQLRAFPCCSPRLRHVRQSLKQLPLRTVGGHEALDTLALLHLSGVDIAL